MARCGIGCDPVRGQGLDGIRVAPRERTQPQPCAAGHRPPPSRPPDPSRRSPQTLRSSAESADHGTPFRRGTGSTVGPPFQGAWRRALGNPGRCFGLTRTVSLALPDRRHGSPVSIPSAIADLGFSLAIALLEPIEQVQQPKDLRALRVSVSLETAVEEDFKTRKGPSHPGGWAHSQEPKGSPCE